MSLLLRFIDDNRGLWRVWLPVVMLAIVAPILAALLPLVQRRLIDDVVLPQRMDLLADTAVLYAGIWLASTGVLVIASILRSYLGERITMQLRHRLFNHSEDLSVAFSRQQHSGRTVSLFVNDVPSLTGLFSTTIVSGLGGLIAMLVGGVVMFRLNPELALAAAIVPLVVAVGAAIVTRPLRPAARRSQEKAAELNERLQENLAGIREVVAFGREAIQAQRFMVSLRELLRLRMRVTLIESTIGVGASLLSLAATLTIFIYGSYLVIESRTTLGTVLAMQSLFGLLFQPATQMMGLFTSAQKALGAADRIYAFLDEVPRVEDDGAYLLTEVDGEVTFDRVNFTYPTGEQVLSGISFVAKPGEVVALVGPSGAGKTTIASLLARFYDPDDGSVRIDDCDLRDIELENLRGLIGFVFQDSFLFHDSIRDNIAFGRPDASDNDVVAAAKAAHAWEFIERLPNGIDTRVGERGMHLSEGQKQRVAIARTLLRDPRILILDEPTSALDARSERLLQAAFENLMQGRTTFVIAHRLATVQRADRILVVDNGRIVEQGTHDELLLLHGLYRELFELQFGPLPEPDAPSQIPPALLVTAEKLINMASLPIASGLRPRLVTLSWCVTQSPWRIGVPLHALRREGYEVVEIGGLDDVDQLRLTDVLVIHQPSKARIVELVHAARDRGVAVIIDVDDLLLPGMLPQHARFARRWDPLYHRKEAEARVTAGIDDCAAIAAAPVNDAMLNLQTCMHSANAVTVPTKALAGAYQHLNPSIDVLPNCYDDTNPLWDLRSPDRSTINIGFLGTEHHGPNLDLLHGVLEPILAEFPSVRIVEAGQGNLLDRITAAPEQLLHLGWLPFETYPLLVQQVDIMLAPLVDEPFMRCKSNIRCMTAGLVGAPVVASPVEPYREYLADGVNGFFATTPGDWTRALRTLVADSALRCRMGEANRAQARSYAMSSNVEKWMQVYDAVHSHRCCA